MRVNFVLSEVATGLRRNLTMTVAMILTTAISLGLMGTGLLIAGMISEMKGIYYDKVQVSIFLAAFSGLYFTVYAVTDEVYRKQPEVAAAKV